MEFQKINVFLKWLKVKNFKKVLFIIGKKSFFATKANEDFDKFIKKNNYVLVKKNNKLVEYKELKKVFILYKNVNFDCIISVGGGGCMDFGKCLKFFLTYDQVTFAEKFKKQKKIIHIVVPTTAGSGSERTQFAVAYRDKKKISLEHKMLRPNVVVFNDKYLVAAPQYVKACAVFDGLVQAIESIWAVRSTKASRKYAYEAIKLYKKNMFFFLKNSGALYAKNVQKAASLAGKAINLTRTTGAHALSYFLTSDMMIPHGHAVAILVKEFFLFNYLNGSKKTQRQITKVMSLFGVRNIEQMTEKWVKMMSRAEMKIYIGEITRTKFNSKQALLKINVERLGNNPVELNKKDIIEIYKKAWKR